jgi:hypothetical protein
MPEFLRRVSLFDSLDLLHELRAARATTSSLEKQTGSIAFISSIFSFVNIMWFLAILGILISIGPVLQTILSHLLAQLRQILRAVWVHVLAHLWRPAVYLVAMSIFAGAHESTVSLDVRVYVCLCTALLVWLLFAVTLQQLVECKALTATDGDYNVLLFYGCVLFVSLAHVLRSSLLGFVAVGVVYSWLGFGMWAIFGGYAVGFGDKERMNRSIFASVVILFSLVFSRLPGGVRFATFLAPYETGLQCFGSTALYLALLIRANPYLIKDSK